MKKLFLVLILMFGVFVVLFGCSKSADSDGSITVIVLDHDDNEEFNDEVSFKKEDTLLGVLQAHETISLKGEMQSYGYYILEVCGINVSDFTNVYWSILVNGEYSLVGISEIDLVDKITVTLSLESF
jgi:hypothetical protein